MRQNKVLERWNKGQAAVSGWLAIGNTYSAEIVGCSGVDCVTIDLQHGMTDVADMIAMLQAISATPAVPFVRVPGCDSAAMMKALDAGAYGLICPMVDTVDQARTFVDATHYPPRGGRSFGPTRGLLYGGTDYFEYADDTIVRLAMIETLAGLNAVEEIVAVDGLQGIFIGPADLGLALGKGPIADPVDDTVLAAISRCKDVAKQARKRIGIFCPSGAAARRYIDNGFDFVVPNHDANLLKAAIAAEVKMTRNA